jgi:OOP family OmpA-OmpF porin
MKLKHMALAALLAPLALTAHAGMTLSVDGGEAFADSAWAGKGNKVDNSTVFGGALGYRWDSGFGLDLDYQRVGDLKIKNAAGTQINKETANLTSLNGYYVFNSQGVFQPFLLLGAGANDINQKFGPSSTKATGNAGLGAFVALSDMFLLRGEVREVHTFGKNETNDTLALLGIQLNFGATKAAEPAPAPAPEPAPAPAPEPAPVVAPPPAAAAPADSDSDGVADSADKCPNTPAGVQVDSTGCPMDADNDGVADYKDKCPNSPAGVQVDAAGCPLDADADGVADYLDKCPNTPAGALVDATGCPKIVTEAIKQEVNVLFDTGKAVIKPESKDEVKKVADLAKEYPTAYIEIQGYTDNKGSKAKNVKLSQQRADAVRDSLVHDFGVDPSHVSSKGYGPANPVADNKTEEGRAKNRHVTAVLTAEKKSMQMGAPKKHHAKKAAPAAQ